MATTAKNYSSKNSIFVNYGLFHAILIKPQFLLCIRDHYYLDLFISE